MARKTNEIHSYSPRSSPRQPCIALKAELAGREKSQLPPLVETVSEHHFARSTVSRLAPHKPLQKGDAGQVQLILKRSNV